MSAHSVFERLRSVGPDQSDWIGPREAAGIATELERLQAMERRAREIYESGSRIDLGEARGRFLAARQILGESS